jgi:diphthamide synthase (EF-2-diphthine--ammonia ligase)
VTCVNDNYLGKEFVGRIIDKEFIADLPENVDPCGENGEFHTFVFDGPLFSKPVNFEIGEIVYRKYIPEKKEKENSEYDCEDNSSEISLNPGFWYCDLIPN